MSILKDLIGRKIVCIRPLSDEDRKLEGWEQTHGATSVIELDNGTLIYPSADDEGNGPGTLFGRDKKGNTFYVWSKGVVK